MDNLNPDLVTEERRTEILKQLGDASVEEVSFYIVASIAVTAEKRETTVEDVMRSIVESRIAFLIEMGRLEEVDKFFFDDALIQ